MQLEKTSAGDWPALPCAIQQHPAYGACVRWMGGAAGMFRLRDGGAEIGRMQVLFRQAGPLPLAWVGCGPVWHDEVPEPVQQAAMVDLPRVLPGMALVQPDRAAEAGWLRAPALMTAPSVAEIDLTAPSGALLARQHGKWRNRLRKAQAGGLVVRDRPLDPAGDAALLDREAAQRRARRYTALPAAFLHHWVAQDWRGTRLFTAHSGGEVVAFMVLLLHAPVATYHIGWSGTEGRRLSAHHLLLWEVCAWLAGKGYTRLDLGTVDTANTPGLARFKIGSGARVRAIGPTLLPLPRFLRHPSAVVRAFPLAIRRNHG